MMLVGIKSPPDKQYTVNHDQTPLITRDYRRLNRTKSQESQFWYEEWPVPGWFSIWTVLTTRWWGVVEGNLGGYWVYSVHGSSRRHWAVSPPWYWCRGTSRGERNIFIALFLYNFFQGTKILIKKNKTWLRTLLRIHIEYTIHTIHITYHSVSLVKRGKSSSC